MGLGKFYPHRNNFVTMYWDGNLVLSERKGCTVGLFHEVRERGTACTFRQNDLDVPRLPRPRCGRRRRLQLRAFAVTESPAASSLASMSFAGA